MTYRHAGRLALSLGLVLALLTAPAAAGDRPQDPPPVPLVSVGYGSDAELERLLDAGLDVVDVDRARQEVLVLLHDYERDHLAAAGIAYTVVEDNLNVFPPAPDDAGATSHGFRTNYRFLPDYYNELQAMASQYPGLTRLETIGHSIENRPIMALEISSAPGVADGRPEHVHMALHHAREWPSGELALDLAWHLLEGYGSDQRSTAIVEGIRTYVVPVVNPDGFNWSRTTQPLWRKNRNPSGSVDLNRNYGYFWGGPGSSGNPSSQTYRGVAPFSEPESRAVRDFYADKHLVTTITGHTHGGWWLFPWGHKFSSPPDQQLYDLAAASVEHSGYVDGPTAQVLYQASGDTTDWAYGTYRSLAFTPEYGTTGSFHPAYLGGGPHHPRVIALGNDVEGRSMVGSVALSGETGRLVDCGLALSPGDCPANTAGAIALIERGGETFANKALNAASRGALGAVVYNNTSGHINGTLGGISVPIPVMGIPRAGGLALLADMASGDVEATLRVAGSHSYAALWHRHLPAFLLNIEGAATQAARIVGSVTSATTGAPLNADLTLTLTRRSFTSSGAWLQHQHTSSISATGAFEWSVLPSRQPELSTPSYTLTVSAPGHHSQQRSVTLNGYGNQAQVNVALQPQGALGQPPRGEASPPGRAADPAVLVP